MPPARPEFRPDLEGLRGITILLVVLFHAGVSGFAGGFVGVDVFFVLSGFFITGLLVREAADTGGINLTEFYGKRALRLLPPLLVVLLATLAAVMWLYAPIDRLPITENARAVALYSGNMAFASGAVDYFSSGENPLLHTWSLAVEQQFYVFWPLLFVFVGFVWDRPTSERALVRHPVFIAMAVAGILSFMLSLVLTRVSQPWAFFGMPTRVWEFALGGMLAVALNTRAAWVDHRGVWLQAAGVLAVAAAVALYDRLTPYPGMAALLPACGAAALLAGGQLAPASVISQIFSASGLRWLGQMSYAWYLWHWPLLGIAGVLNPHIGAGGKLLWCAGALLLAWLTHRFVEHPARNGGLAFIPSRRVALVSFGATVVAAMIAQGATFAAKRSALAPEQMVLAAAREDRMDHGCWANTVEDRRKLCVFGDSTASTTVVLFGDSHAEHWIGGLDRVARARGWKVLLMVKGGCPVADIPQLMRVRLKRYYHECTRYREAMVQEIIALKPTVAILSSWNHYIGADGEETEWQVAPEAWKAGLHRTYSRLSAAGVPVVAIRGTPRTWFNVPGCLSRRAAGLPFANSCEYDRANSMLPQADAAQTEAAQGLRVRFVDMTDQICSAEQCGVVRNGTVVFTDDNHLTASFSRSVAPLFGERIARAASDLGRQLP